MARSPSLEGPLKTPPSPAALVPRLCFVPCQPVGSPVPPRCSSAVRNGLLLLNLLLCNHHTLGDQIITQELRDTLFRHSGIAPGTEPMPTTRTILTMLLSRYSEPRGSPERAGTMAWWMGCFAEEGRVPHCDQESKLTFWSLNEGYKSLQEMTESFSAPARGVFERRGGGVIYTMLWSPGWS